MNKKEFIKNNIPTILSIIGGVGAVATAVLGVRAGIKIGDYIDDTITIEHEKPKKKEIAKLCIPVAIACGTTVACGISADILNRGQKNDLLAMCMAIGSSYSGYRQEVVRRYGAEVDKEIVDTVAKCPEVCCMCPDIPDKKVHWIIDMCVDSLGQYELDAYERDVINAERHLNRNYILGGEQSYGDFLRFLGFEVASFDNENVYGWAINDSEIYYLDFYHSKIDENTFKITPIFAPWYRFDELDMWGNEY